MSDLTESLRAGDAANVLPNQPVRASAARRVGDASLHRPFASSGRRQGAGAGLYKHAPRLSEPHCVAFASSENAA